jgi:hypothetical protein
MTRLRRQTATPPPIVAPPVNARVALLVDGARYGGRVDDITEGGLVVAAPDISLPLDRPVLVEWRDAAGLWQLPGEVTDSRLYPFPTTTVRPSGASECVSPATGAMSGSMRISARVVASSRLPAGARVPLTTVSMRGDRIMLWTIIPVERGDRLDCISSLSDGRLVRARCTVQNVRSRPGTWLVHAECTLDEPGDSSTAALLQALVGSAGSRTD